MRQRMLLMKWAVLAIVVSFAAFWQQDVGAVAQYESHAANRYMNGLALHERLHGSHGHVGQLSKQFENMCGNWHDHYSWLHKDILKGIRAPRYAVVKPDVDGGLADCLSCIGSIFYFSLLAGRALLIDEQNGGSANNFSAAYSQPNINWIADLASLGNFSSVSYKDVQAHGPPPQGPTVEIFRNGNVKNIGEGMEVVYFTECNAGLVGELFNNHNHRQELLEMGLRPETAFGCMFWYLFEPNQKVQKAVQGLLPIMTNSSILKIGLQLRIGDATLNKQRLDDPTTEEAEAELLPYAPWFECAEKMESSPGAQGREVRWFFLSDSLFLRKSVAQKYGEKIITNLGEAGAIQHTRSGGDDAMVTSAGEHWLFSMADYHICTHSGFGRTSAMISLKWQNYILIANHHEWGFIPDGCYTREMEQIHTIPPGIK